MACLEQILTAIKWVDSIKLRCGQIPFCFTPGLTALAIFFLVDLPPQFVDFILAVP